MKKTPIHKRQNRRVSVVIIDQLAAELNSIDGCGWVTNQATVHFVPGCPKVKAHEGP
jgi:hypothetical protein